jgi:hypothetical protein
MLTCDEGRNPSLYRCLSSARAWGWSDAAIEALALGQYPHLPAGEHEFSRRELDSILERVLAYQPGDYLAYGDPTADTYTRPLAELQRIGWSTEAMLACMRAEVVEVERIRAAAAEANSTAEYRGVA